MRWHSILTVLLAATIFRALAESEPPAGWPFEYQEGLIRVRVKVPQSSAPLQFLVDTGASTSVIDLHTARRLSVERGGRVRVRGVHSSTDGYWPTRLTATLGEVSLPDVVLAVDLRKLSGACDASVDGLLGLDFFRDRIVQIDFVAKQIRLLDPNGPGPAGESLPLEIRRCGMRLPVAVNDGKTQWVRLDTGCASAFQWVTAAVRSDRCERRIAIGLDRIAIPQTTTQVRLGTVAFEAVPTGLHHREIFPGESGLLGNDLLARFSSVTIDARSSRLVLGGRLPGLNVSRSN